MTVLGPRRNRGRVLGAALVLALAAATSGAHADPAAVEDLIKKGNDHRTKGEDQWALPLFQKAYDLERSPRTAAQLGLVEAALGYWLSSERHLQEALTSTRNPWLIRFEKQIRDTLAHVQASIGEVEVNGSPKGAQVIINGQPAGQLPLPQPVRVGEGALQVTLRAPGYKEATSHSKVNGGQRVTVSVALEQLETPAPTSRGSRAPETRGAGPELAAPGPPGDDHPAGWVRPAAWAAAAGAVAALAVGGYGLHTQRTKGQEFDNFTGGTMGRLCGATRPDKGGSQCKSLYNQAQTGKQLMIGGFAAGGALAVASLVGFVASTSETGGGDALSIEVAPGSLAVGWSARF